MFFFPIEGSTIFNMVIGLTIWAYLVALSVRYPSPYGGSVSDMLMVSLKLPFLLIACGMLRVYLTEHFAGLSGAVLVAQVLEVMAYAAFTYLSTARHHDQLMVNRAEQHNTTAQSPPKNEVQ